MKIIDLENIKIPSVNEKYIKIGVLSPKYRMWKEYLARSCVRKKLTGPYRIEIYIDTYKDIDNCVKLIIDAVASAGVIDDDKNVVQLFVSKQPIKKGKPEKLIVLAGDPL
jgi:Holliday junction resolvase RusA-like endonuclease